MMLSFEYAVGFIFLSTLLIFVYAYFGSFLSMLRDDKLKDELKGFAGYPDQAFLIIKTISLDKKYAFHPFFMVFKTSVLILLSCIIYML
jgi:hypothetical protein